MVRFYYSLHHCLINKIDLYVTSNTVVEDRCTCIAIRELCNIRDGIDHLIICPLLLFTKLCFTQCALIN